MVEDFMQSSVWNEIARLRFPAARQISGSGPIAVVVPCEEKVVLCETEMETVALTQSCWICASMYGDKKQRHVVVNLAVRPEPRFVRKPHWARDIETV
jgi:hypothetical protein